MENLKIRVNSEAESKEAKSLLESLGFDIDFREEGFKYSYLFAYVNGMHVTGDDREGHFKNKNNKEITLSELRDLVVLKRNSIDDATHEDKNDPEFKYRLIDNNWYVITEGNPVWRKDSIDLNEAPLFIKPIEKTMKEYLEKQADGSYKLVMRGIVGKDGDIEVPEGATYYAIDSNLGIKKNYFFRCPNDAIWVDSQWMSASFSVAGQTVLWQRHTHPEELPFIDDEPKITTAKGSELDYIAKTHDMRDRYDGESDEDYRYQLEHYISRKEPSLNDQYAEIEKVRQSHRTASETADPTIKETLSQRQEQYGSFEDVAMITEQMVDVMRKGYYENLAYNQKMALYMICSKMARIVNGNHNFIESWHDIAGYATLIDNELVSEKDMPF